MKTLESKSKPKQHYDSQQRALILMPFYSQKLYLSVIGTTLSVNLDFIFEPLIILKSTQNLKNLDLGVAFDSAGKGNRINKKWRPI